MTFEELKLAMAIRDVNDRTDKRDREDRHGLWCAVYQKYVDRFDEPEFPFSELQVNGMHQNVRKSGDTKTKCEIAIANGWRCFWRHRGKGKCSEQVHAGHILPRSGGHDLTVENGVIECEAHNLQRGVMSIEEYLKSELKT